VSIAGCYHVMAPSANAEKGRDNVAKREQIIADVGKPEKKKVPRARYGSNFPPHGIVISLGADNVAFEPVSCIITPFVAYTPSNPWQLCDRLRVERHDLLVQQLL